MAGQVPVLQFSTDFDAETGRPVAVAHGTLRITAPNAGPFTFKGTNSFIIGTDSVAVLDPGPDSDAHLAALVAAIGGRRVEAIILTHTHLDHSALVARLRDITHAPVWSGGAHRLSRPRRLLEFNPVGRDSDWRHVPDRVLADGERFSVGGITLETIATPGHCANHLAFGLLDTPWLFTGDHIMGWNSTLVSVPDGSMSDYLCSLEKVLGLGYSSYLPAHGGAIVDGPAYARALLAHRQERNGQIVAAVRGGARGIGDLLRTIYPEISPLLRGAARMTLKAHVEYLADRGLIGAYHSVFGTSVFPAIG